MSVPSLLGFACFFLSFLQIKADGAGSFIALDVASAIYFLVYPGRLLRYSSILKWLAWALMALVVTRVLIGANEFVFLARLALIFVDAFFLGELFKARRRVSQDALCSHALWLAALAYASAFILWLGMPDGTESFFYLNSPKAWIATFPALFSVSHLIGGRHKPAILLALMSGALSLFDTSTSRALLLQSLLLFSIALWEVNRKIAVAAAILACVSAPLFMNWFGNFVETHDHSNTFRLVMILQIFDFSISELVFGRGIDGWRLAAFGALYYMPGAEAFFESANPHFFPAELIIRGGGGFLFFALCAFYATFRRSRLIAVPLVMLLSTSLTTNTGVERMYMTIAIFILISTPFLYNTNNNSTLNGRTRCENFAGTLPSTRGAW